MDDDWLDGSGWINVLKQSFVNTPGRIDSFIKCSNGKRKRYAHQITLASLIALAEEAFSQHQCQTLEYEECKSLLYWLTVIEMETLLLMFVRSLRESDFELFVRCIRDMLPWLFALDHTNYARWMSVFFYDLTNIQNYATDVFLHFKNGAFTIKKI